MDSNIIQTFAVLAVAVGIIAGIMMLVKKISVKRSENRASVSMNVISKITLQPKNHLFVVKVADKILILGVTDNSINILTELAPGSDNIPLNKLTPDKADDILKTVSLGNNMDVKELQNDLSFANFIKSAFKFK